MRLGTWGGVLATNSPLEFNAQAYLYTLKFSSYYLLNIFLNAYPRSIEGVLRVTQLAETHNWSLTASKVLQSMLNHLLLHGLSPENYSSNTSFMWLLNAGFQIWHKLSKHLTSFPSFPMTIFSFNSFICFSDPDNLYRPSSFIPLASISSMHCTMRLGTWGGVLGTNSSSLFGSCLFGVPATGTQGRGTPSLQSGWHTARQSVEKKKHHEINLLVIGPKLVSLCTQQNSYSISHLLGTVTTQWLSLWRCSHCSLVPDTVTTEQWQTLY